MLSVVVLKLMLMLCSTRCLFGAGGSRLEFVDSTLCETSRDESLAAMQCGVGAIRATKQFRQSVWGVYVAVVDRSAVVVLGGRRDVLT